MCKEELIDLLYPRDIKCIVCDEELPAYTRYGVCDKCELPHNDTFCSVCGRAIAAQNTVCDACKRETYSFAAARSSFAYRDAAAKLVQRLKYGDERYLATYMAQYMTDTYFFADWNVDVVTYVPLHKSRLRTRGYNQSELLANAVGAGIRKPCAELLRKSVKTKHMVGLSRAERLQNLRDSFAVADGASAAGKTVLLIDDVFTTGSTASECARVLCGGGATCVYVLTFASVRQKPPESIERKIQRRAEV